MALFRRSNAPPAAARPAEDAHQRSRELQKLWFAVTRQPWSSLVVMDTAQDGGARQVAQALCQVGTLYRGAAVKLMDVQGADLSRAVPSITEMTSHVLEGGLVVVVTDPVVHNATGVPVAMAADAVLLVVTLGETEQAAVQRTLELVGRERIVGVVTLQGAPDAREAA
jgi:hypothetical protein